MYTFFTLFLFIGVAGLNAQVQLGKIIFGTADLDRTGSDVALSADGSRFAVGSSAFDDNFRGRVQVFEWNGSTMMWEQIGSDLDNSGINTSSFGSTLSMSDDGNRVAVGASSSSNLSMTEGLVRVFEWDANTQDWIQLGADFYGEFLDQIGGAVSLSGDGKRLAIGNDANNLGPGSEPGSAPGEVLVYEYNENSTSWELMGAVITGLEAFDDFGGSVALSGDGSRVVASGSFYQMGEGVVQVYEWDEGDEAWERVGPVNIVSGLEPGSEAGWELDISADGNRIASSRDLDLLPNLGRVQVFEWSNNAWTQVGADMAGPPSTGLSTYGYDLSMSADGNRVAFSGAATPDFEFGAVVTYSWNGTTQDWEQLGDIIGPPPVSPGELVYDYGDGSVDLSANGGRLAIGGGYDTATESEVGLAHVFGLTSIASTTNPILEQLAIYPNPSSGLVQIKGVQPVNIRIVDYLGRVVFFEGNPDNQVDISNLPAGIYTLIAEFADGQLAGSKLIKE